MPDGIGCADQAPAKALVQRRVPPGARVQLVDVVVVAAGQSGEQLTNVAAAPGRLLGRSARVDAEGGQAPVTFR